MIQASYTEGFKNPNPIKIEIIADILRLMSLSVKGCMDALKIALSSRKNKTLPLIHHSDRGVQYCCNEYVSMLLEKPRF